MSESLQPRGLQHARPPCPSPTPRVYSNSCPLSQWCHLTISSSAIPFSSCLQSFPASGSFQISQFFASGGQRVGSFSFSISPSTEYSGLISFTMDWLDLLVVQGTIKRGVQYQYRKSIYGKPLCEIQQRYIIILTTVVINVLSTYCVLAYAFIIVYMY